MGTAIYILSSIVILAGLYASSLYNYLLFHSIAEGFSVVIACGIFMVAWNTRHFTNRRHLLFLGVAYLFVGILDFIHALSYEGMNVFIGFGPNVPTQLWIAARYMESLTLLVAPMVPHRRIKPIYYLSFYLVISALLILSIMVWRNFPVCFITGSGLTPFKVVSEYIICTILVAAGSLFIYRRENFEKGFLTWTLSSIGVTIVSELAFTIYANVFGFSNLVGHFLKIISFYLIYKAVIETGLAKPYKLLFSDLNRQRERFQVILNSIVDAVIATDAEGRITFINPVAEALTGWKHPEALGQAIAKVFRVIDGETAQPLEGPVASILRQRRMSPLESDILVTTRDNTAVPIESTAAPLKDTDGQVRGAVLVFRDITELKAAEERTRHLASFPKLNPDPILEVTADGTVVYSNRATRKALEKLGLTIDDAAVFFPEDAEAILKGLDKKQEQSIYREVAIGDRIFGETIYLTPQFNVARIYAADITEKEEADRIEKRGKARQELLATVAERLLRAENPETIIDELCRQVMAHIDCQAFFNFMVDIPGSRLRLNAYAGISPESVDKMRHLAFGEAVCGSVAEKCQPVIAEEIQQNEYPLTNLVKSIGMQAYCCHPLTGPGGLIGTLSFGTKTRPKFTDDEVALMKSVSDQVSVAMQQMLSAKKLQKFNETLEEQIAIRTELAESRARQLQALAVELTEAEERERQRIAQLLHDDLQQMLAAARMQIEAACNRLPEDKNLATVEKLLLESIGKSRHLSQELSPPVLHHAGLSDALIWLVRQMKAQFGLQVNFNENQCPVVENSFLKVFIFRSVQELLFNVFKHAGEKKARLGMTASGDSLKVTVSDNGQGFNAESLDITTASGGFGLLSLSERAQYIGGSLVIDSTPGKGSCLTLTVPLSLLGTVQITMPEPYGFQNAAPADPVNVTAPNGIRLLLVDDHKVMRQGLVQLVKGQPDVQVVGEAANGIEAIELVRQLQPNVVVMDVSMPEMDGVEATRRISVKWPDVHVIGLSMLEDDHIVERMRDAGAKMFVNKTTSSAELLKAIYRVVRQS